MTSWNLIANPAKRTIRVITPVTGTTVNAYVEAVDLDTRWLTEEVFTIANTGSNILEYRVNVYNDYKNGIAYETTTNTVSAGDSDQLFLCRHARIKVDVKSAASGSHTAYQIDCLAGRA